MGKFIQRFTVTVLALAIAAGGYFAVYRVFCTRVLPEQLQNVDPFSPPLWLRASEIVFTPAEAVDAWLFRLELERHYRRHYSGAWRSVDGALALTTEYDDGRLAVNRSGEVETFDIFNQGVNCFIYSWHHGDSVLEFSPTNPDIALLHVPQDGLSELKTFHLVRLDPPAVVDPGHAGWLSGS